MELHPSRDPREFIEPEIGPQGPESEPVEGVCDDCCQYGEIEEVEGYRLCSSYCATHTGRNPAEIRRLQRALEREAGAYAREHSYLIDPTYRAE